MDVERVKSRTARQDLQALGGIARLDRAAAALADARGAVDALHRRISDRAAPRVTLGHMAAMLTACAAGRPGTTAHAAALAQAQICRRFPPLDLPARQADPATTIVICAPDAQAAMRALSGCRHAEWADIALADDGRDPELALLGLAVQPLDIVRGTSLAEACNAAAASARGATIVLAGGSVDAHVLSPHEAWVGGSALAALNRLGVSLGPPRPSGSKLHLAVPRARWHDAGGLDAQMADGQGLELADLCLRLRLLGVRLVPVEAPGGEPWFGPSSWNAPAAFRTRWGDLTFAGFAA